MKTSICLQITNSLARETEMSKMNKRKLLQYTVMKTVLEECPHDSDSKRSKG